MQQVCRQTLKSLAAECHVGIRFWAAAFLTDSVILSMWIDSLVACIWGAAGCLFATDVDDGVPASGLVGWWVGHLSVAGRNLVSFPPE